MDNKKTFFAIGGLLLVGWGVNAMDPTKPSTANIKPPSSGWTDDVAKNGDYPEGHIKESFLGRDRTRTLSECNNPGSIKQFRSNGAVINPNNPWRGSIPWQENTDGDFVQFTSFAWGLRATILLLKNYIDRENRNTITKIIQYWDNGNLNYINHLVTHTDFTANQVLQADKDTLYQLTRFITVMEQGWFNDLVTDKRFDTAYGLL